MICFFTTPINHIIIDVLVDFVFGCAACLTTPANIGAGLSVRLANLTITDSEFIGNNAGQVGGAIAQTGAGFTNIQNTNFEYNNAEAEGGAIGIATVSDTDRWMDGG